MPELPEVETSRRGIAPFVEGAKISGLVVRERRLRWPVPDGLEKALIGQTVKRLDRRAKYLLFRTSDGTMLLHLGMSGSLRIIDPAEPAGKHDHVDMLMNNGRALRFRDPRRFGSLLWSEAGTVHPLLAKLGPEPLGSAFDGDYLWQRARGRRVAIKPFIMNAGIVVGVGNIYASEALFEAGIHPLRQAGRTSKVRMRKLADSIGEVLQRALTAGGTTLRDFSGGDGEPGYFQQQLSVYGREGRPCRRCNEPLKCIVLGQRSTYYCKRCQT
ncbi:MAG: bifunctional DNA-formamidopyrimidine glycosylase/DNA-(apurinic or apyrimidinic site) lyase [Halioglobus sp.]|nr:bifunctional DNA-formamidopyrimidine glycosylase/DNA-(apurinic or apyrimidinic site) lyase [Halioglobus sp.]